MCDKYSGNPKGSVNAKYYNACMPTGLEIYIFKPIYMCTKFQGFKFLWYVMFVVFVDD